MIVFFAAEFTYHPVQTLRGQRSRRNGNGFRPTLIECKPEDVDG
jgi:hypothetical protein